MIKDNDIEKVLQVYPGLSAEGLNKAGRPLDKNHVAVAVKWLKKQERRISVNPTCSSYNLKHVVERAPGGVYITNGAFIAAAVLLGFTIQHLGSSPNVRINISNSYRKKIK
tara:strand:+ start:903 stop:1235 length:333 start_codon:yes stop_codon:yes gene_type:complete